MKIVKFILLFLVVSIISCDKEEVNYTEKLFHKYKEKSNFYYFDVPPGLITVFIEDKTEEDRQLKAALKKLSSIKLLMYKTFGNNSNKRNDVFADIDNYYNKNKYDDLTVITKYNEQITIKYFEHETAQKELIVLLNDQKSFVTLALAGNFDFQTLTTLLKFGNIETLKKITDK